MKAVILAAGRGIRMGELTKSTPKGLLKKNGRPLLDYTFSVLPSYCEEIIVVIGYLGDQIRNMFGNSWRRIPITYVEQGKHKGTGGALRQVEKYLKRSDFLVLPCDDAYIESDILKLCESAPTMMISVVQDKSVSGGNVKVENDRLVSITEGTHNPPVTVATGAYYLNDKIFEHQFIRIPGRDEYGLPQTVAEYAKLHPVRIIEATSWIQVTSPEDLI